MQTEYLKTYLSEAGIISMGNSHIIIVESDEDNFIEVTLDGELKIDRTSFDITDEFLELVGEFLDKRLKEEGGEFHDDNEHGIYGYGY